MRAGDLDQVITVQRKQMDWSAPEPKEDWVDLLTCRAARRDVSAGESYRAQAVQAKISSRFTVRWSPQTADVKPTDRIKFAGRNYNITGARDVGRQRFRELDAVAEDN